MRNGWRLDFESEGHRYTLNGKRAPSVTQVLDPLQSWDGIPPDVLEAARQFGTYVHAACHLHNLDRLNWDELDPLLRSYLDGYRLFIAESGFVVLSSEARVASVKYGYAGTLDLTGVLNKRDALIDIKSTASLPRTVGPQTAAYEQALLETVGQRIRRRFALQLKPGGYKLVALDGAQDFSVFLSALNIHRWRAAA